MTNNLNLKGLGSVFKTTLNNELQDNLVEFFEWSLLEKGNYFNVTLGELSENNSDYSRLKLSNNENYTTGQAWEGFRSNWVWQSGISFTPPPIVAFNNALPGISGVYLNDSFLPTSTTGQYQYKIDYYNGRVVFDNPIPTGSKVQAEYSYKYINLFYSNSLPWLSEVQYRSLDIPENFLQPKTGFDLPPESKLQLPAIAIEVVPKRTMKGYQLGGGQIVSTDVLFHCIAEDEYTRNKLVDIISYQNDRDLTMFDSNELAASGAFPLDHVGTPVSGALRYPELIQNFPGGTMTLKNTVVQGMKSINTNFYAGIVRMTIDIIKLNI
jgi:hypothetical protein